MFSKIRTLFAPIIIRFQDTEGLEETLNFLSMVDHDKIEPALSKWVLRTERIIAKELVRRGVKIWEF